MSEGRAKTLYLSQGHTLISKASHNRLADAKVLLEAARYRGAMYIAGYAVECRIKATLMERFRAVNLPQLELKLRHRFKTHNLVELAGLLPRWEKILENKEFSALLGSGKIVVG